METIAFEPRTLESTAAILLNNIISTLNKSDSSDEDLENALKPFAIIQWTRPIIEKLGVGKINRMFGRLKRTKVPKPTLRLIIDHFTIALSDQGALMPIELAEWRTILTKYSLNILADYATWTLVIQFLKGLNFPTPESFAEAKIENISPIVATSPYCDLINAFWQALRIEFASAKGLTPLTVKYRSDNFSLVQALRADSVEESEFGKELSAAAGDLNLPENFGRLGPKARIIALQNIAPDSQPLLRFLPIGAQANILEQVRSTLPCVASGVGCYLSFCSLLAIAPFPPTTEGVARWSALFPPGKTFSIYLSHLAKACQLLGFDSSWKTDVIIAICKGLKNKPSGKNRFHNSLEPPLLDKIIRKESWASEFARLCFVAYLFMLRLPSEALPLIMAKPEDRLVSTDHSSPHALIGLRNSRGSRDLSSN